MATWVQFSAAQPHLATAIRELIHQYGAGLGYLATVRADGGPRVHPVSPVIMDDGLYCFVIDSPKRRDLDRDGRYALHAFPPEDNDDEAYIAGRATRVTDQARVERLVQAYRAEYRSNWLLYEFSVDVAMVACRREGGGPPGTETEIWSDAAAQAADVPTGTGIG